VAAADAYRATGSKEAAQCVLQLEKTAALDNVFTGKMSSSQAYFVQGWVTGALAIAYLKVRDSGVVNSEDAALITSWMQTVTRQTMNFYESTRNVPFHGKGNNHLYWAGVQAGAVAIAANDRTMFDWCLAAYRNGILQITPEGTLPEEMRRGQRALHYHLYAASPLVYLAEFGEVNGIGLYAENNGALKLLVQRATAGLAGSGFFDQKTRIKQDAPNGLPTGEEIGWAKVYVKRFPDPAISALIAKTPSLAYMYLGGLPAYN
jgi:poly(beta-D-mannuronate) lyase